MPSVTDFSKAYDVKRNTIRRWTAEFAEFFSPDANPEPGEVRQYTFEDASVIALIATMREDNAPFERIHAALADGERGEWPPPEQFNDMGDQSGDVPPMALVTKLSAELAHTAGKLTAVIDERDKLAKQLEAERLARLEAEKRAAVVSYLESEGERLRAENERLQAHQQALQAPQQPEQPKNFWRWLTGK